MKTVLSFIFVFLFSLQFFSQNLSFTKINEDKLNIGSYKTGKVIHYPPEFPYSYQSKFVYSTDKGKTIIEKEIPDIIDEAKKEYINNSKEDLKIPEETSTYSYSGIYNSKIIFFYRRFHYSGYSSYEAAYSEDGLKFKYVTPFELKGTFGFNFNLIDDAHFSADDLFGTFYSCTISKKGTDIKVEVTPVEFPYKVNYYCNYTEGKIIFNSHNTLFLSSDYGKTFNKIFSDSSTIYLAGASSNDKYILVSESRHNLISVDNGKTFLSTPNHSYGTLPVYYKNKYYYIKPSEGIFEMKVGKTAIEHKAAKIKNTPKLTYTCSDLKEIDGKIILMSGEFDGYNGECNNKVFYELK